MQNYKTVLNKKLNFFIMNLGLHSRSTVGGKKSRHFLVLWKEH